MLHIAITQTPEQRRAHEVARRLLIATRLTLRAKAYADALTATGGRITQNVEYAEIELLDVIQSLTECDEIGELIDDRCREVGLDTEGYHVNDDGGRCRFRDRELMIGGRF